MIEPFPILPNMAAQSRISFALSGLPICRLFVQDAVVRVIPTYFLTRLASMGLFSHPVGVAICPKAFAHFLAVAHHPKGIWVARNFPKDQPFKIIDVALRRRVFP
jgi:hypothetical protein